MDEETENAKKMGMINFLHNIFGDLLELLHTKTDNVYNWSAAEPIDWLWTGLIYKKTEIFFQNEGMRIMTFRLHLTAPTKDVIDALEQYKLMKNMLELLNIEQIEEIAIPIGQLYEQLVDIFKNCCEYPDGYYQYPPDMNISTLPTMDTFDPSIHCEMVVDILDYNKQ